MLLRFAALILVATAVFLVHRAAAPIVEQNRRVASWPQVDAILTARFVDVPPRPGARPPRGPGEVAAPQLQVEYRHEVGGVIHRKIHTTPRSQEYEFAGPELVTQRESSQTRRAHYDPDRPGELFFPKPFGFADYWQIFFWGPLLALGFGGLVLRKPGYSSQASTDRAAEKGWYRLLPKYSIRHRASGAAGVAVVTNVIVGLAAYDYFTGVPRARTPLSDALVLLALVPAVATVALAVYYLWLARRVGDARVAVNAARVTAGSRLAVKVELPVKANIDLEHVTVSLACVRSYFAGVRGFRERVIWEERSERSVGGGGRGGNAKGRAPAGGRIIFEQRFTVPLNADPTFAGGLAGPWIDWEVRVQFHLDNGPDYRGKFPLIVDIDRPADHT